MNKKVLEAYKSRKVVYKEAARLEFQSIKLSLESQSLHYEGFARFGHHYNDKTKARWIESCIPNAKSKILMAKVISIMGEADLYFFKTVLEQCGDVEVELKKDFVIINGEKYK
jgi:hypothetical protein